MSPVPPTSNFMPLQPCNAKSDLSASRYSSWWAMRRGGLSTDKVRTESCLQERSASPRNVFLVCHTAETNPSLWCRSNIQGARLARESDNSVQQEYRVIALRGQASLPQFRISSVCPPIVENNFDAVPNRDIKPLQMVVLSRF